MECFHDLLKILIVPSHEGSLSVQGLGERCQIRWQNPKADTMLDQDGKAIY